jgi:hypothetical protein
MVIKLGAITVATMTALLTLSKLMG